MQARSSLKSGLVATIVGAGALALSVTGCTVPGQAKPLKATVTVGWLNVADGAALPYYPGAPGSIDCNSPHPGTGEGCGSITVSALVTGFAAYGGTPNCSVSGSSLCDPQSYLTGQLKLTWKLVCSATNAVTTDSSVVTLAPAFQSAQDHVSQQTRVNNDTARLGLAADLPLGDDIAACAGPSTLQSVSASAVKLHLVGGKRYPDSDFAASGPFES